MFNGAQAVDDHPDLSDEKADPDQPAAVLAITRDEEASYHPYSWPQSRKLLMLYTAVSATFLTGLNATSEATAAEAINVQFGISDASFPNSYWPISSWNTGGAVAPLVLLPLMENFGIRYIYLVRLLSREHNSSVLIKTQLCYFMFVIFLIPQAVAQNFATIVVSRFFAGAFGATVQNAVANFAGDMWENDIDRSFSITLFNTAYLGGFTLGPVSSPGTYESVN